MSPDTVSSLFPDRPIRPLPKRRLRERLSPEVADSIKYPPSTNGAVPLFQYPPYALKEDGGHASIDLSSPRGSARYAATLDAASKRIGEHSGNEDEHDAGARSTLVTRSPPDLSNRANWAEQARHGGPQAPPSPASSADGYDSFENTNNKKKRKIPTAGDSSMSGAHSLSSEINALALCGGASTPSTDSSLTAERAYLGSNGYPTPTSYTAANQGISGSGRGRLGRSGNCRSPLRALSDGSNGWSGRGGKAGTSHWSAGNDSGGIISSAIASAGKFPLSGQENISLLRQHSSIPKASPALAQFTFTCDSQVPGALQWPGQSSRHPLLAQTFSTPPTAHSRSEMNRELPPNSTGGQPAQSRRRTRRQLEKELSIAARRRRQIAAENFYHSPPKVEDMWICELCEYERIFGEPPRALIRDYEIKDRRYRQDEADRKRLLEKAKARSRKGRKNSKAANKSTHHGHHQPSHGPADYIDDHHEALPMHHSHSCLTQSEEEYDGENEDGYTQSLSDLTYPAEEGGGDAIRERAKT